MRGLHVRDDERVPVASIHGEYDLAADVQLEPAASLIVVNPVCHSPITAYTAGRFPLADGSESSTIGTPRGVVEINSTPLDAMTLALLTYVNGPAGALC